MKKRMKFTMCIMTAVLLLFSWIGGSVETLAAGNAAITEAHVKDDSVVVYAKGFENNDFKVNVGTKACDEVSVSGISGIETLILLDNSRSIPKNDRPRIIETLNNIINDRQPGDTISVATFSREINYRCDFTDDYTTLKRAVDEITFDDQESYLTDVLYTVLVNNYQNSTSDSYQRILVISDGVDDKSIGYTKDELYGLLDTIKVPIITVGCNTGNNNELLSNLFALSRKTNADSILFSDVKDLLEINDTLNTDRAIAEVTISPDNELLDGATKSVQLSAGGTTASIDIKMPQKEYVAPKEEPVEKEPVVQEVVEKTPEPEPEPEEEEEDGINLWLIIGIAAGVLIVAAAVVVIILKTRKSKEKNAFKKINEVDFSDDFDAKTEFDSKTQFDSEKTDFFSYNTDSDKTVGLWESVQTYNVVLTDIANPTKSFSMPINSRLVIGRRPEKSDIVIDYDNSISKGHCQITTRDNRFYISDLQSANGTYLNDCKVLSETEIVSGNIIKIGRVKLKFEVR